jgi:soluble lytic murein transglycosylase-like protein
VLALISVESNFERFAISSAGAQGLMQIMPFWLDEIGRPDDNLFDIATNLRFGCTILNIYLKRERATCTRRWRDTMAALANTGTRNGYRAAHHLVQPVRSLAINNTCCNNLIPCGA